MDGGNRTASIQGLDARSLAVLVLSLHTYILSLHTYIKNSDDVLNQGKVNHHARNGPKILFGQNIKKV